MNVVENGFTQFTWTHDHFGTTYLGVPMLQKWVDLVLWEKLLNAHKVSSILELGTGSGAFSMYLLMQTIHRGIEFKTFDNGAVHSIDEALKKYLTPLKISSSV